MQFEPIHPYITLPHLLALFSIVKTVISTTDYWILNFIIWLVKFMAAKPEELVIQKN